MTEPTIAEVLAANPDAKEFVDAKGNEWEFGSNGYCKNLKITYPVSREEYDLFAIPGLRPKSQKRTVTVDGFTSIPGVGVTNFNVTAIYRNDVPAKLTYEIEEPEPEKRMVIEGVGYSPYSVDEAFDRILNNCSKQKTTMDKHKYKVTLQYLGEV